MSRESRPVDTATTIYTPVLVVGAGPTGLGVAYKLADQVSIIDREERVGGLCRSFAIGKCIFDLGGHAFFTKHADVDRLLIQLAQGMFAQDRKAFVYAHQRFLPYPFQAHLFGLPAPVVIKCVLGAVNAYAAAQSCEQRSNALDEWIVATFGRGIADEFMLPYNRKLWAFPLSEIVTEWTGNRIVQPDIESIIVGALAPEVFDEFPNHRVRYPLNGGFEQIYAPFARLVGDPLLGDEVVHIDLSAHTAQTSRGRHIEYDTLVSTMPLDRLVASSNPRPAWTDEAAARLHHNSLILVNLVTKESTTEMQRIYVADPDVPFHKLVMNSNSSPFLQARGQFGLQAEVSYSTNKTLQRADLVAQVEDAVRAMGILRARDKILDSSVVDISYAYPVPMEGTAKSVKDLKEFFQRHSVYTIGRFGEWAYINSDEALKRGLDLGTQLALRLDMPARPESAGRPS